MDCRDGAINGLDRKTFEAAFARKCGLVPPSIAEMKFRNPGDAPLVYEALIALAEGKVSNPYQASELVYKRATGPTPEQNRDRLRKAIARLLKKGTAKGRQS
jgi:hypothetical protein